MSGPTGTAGEPSGLAAGFLAEIDTLVDEATAGGHSLNRKSFRQRLTVLVRAAAAGAAPADGPTRLEAIADMVAERMRTNPTEAWKDGYAEGFRERGASPAVREAAAEAVRVWESDSTPLTFAMMTLRSALAAEGEPAKEEHHA